MFPANIHGFDDVLDVTRNDDPDGDLAVVRGICGIDGAGARVESDFALDAAVQLPGERGGIGGRDQRSMAINGGVQMDSGINDGSRHAAAVARL